jgi:Zn-dependent protease
MDASLRVGRLFGIPVGLHWSWFLVFLLVTWSLAGMYFVLETPELPGRTNWILGVVTSLLFFGSVLAHEFGHAIVALRNKIPVRSITLFIFGGVAHIGQEPNTPGAEFRVAIAGPATSLALAGLFGLVALAAPDIPQIAAPSEWLARINLALAAFNMIPGFPLDGGRVLRAILWWSMKSYLRANRIAAYGGQLVAFGFIFYGIFSVFGGNYVNGLWLAFIGWFLNSAANSAHSSRLPTSIDDIPVENVMSPDLNRIAGSMSIAELVDEKLLPSGQSLFYVSDGEQPQGMLTFHHLAAVPRKDWSSVTVEEIMTPWDQLIHIPTDMRILHAMHAMEQARLPQVPVMRGDKVAGFLTREQIFNYLRWRTEMGT